VLGFSAGTSAGDGRLSAGVCQLPAGGCADHQPATADGAALIHPVITLLPPSEPYGDPSSAGGPQASEAADRAWSVQTWVTTATPPCFLVQAQDDPISDPHNTLLMADACRQHQVPVQLFRYTRGGWLWHGAPGNADDRLAHGGLCRLAEGAGVHDGAKIVALPHDGATAAGRGRLFWRFLHNQTAGLNRFAQRRGGR
jgi:acetyl esterase/lipase